MLFVIMELTTAELEKPLIWLAHSMFPPTGLKIFRHCKDLAFVLVIGDNTSGDHDPVDCDVLFLLHEGVTCALWSHIDPQEAEYTATTCNVMASDVGQAFGVPEGNLYIYFNSAMSDITSVTQSCLVTTQQPLTFNNNFNHSNLQQPQVLTTEIAPTGALLGRV